MWWILKILGFFIAIPGLSFIASLLIHLWRQKALPRDPSTGKLNIKVNPWLLTAVALGVSILWASYLDGRPLFSLGLHWYTSWWQEFTVGTVIGALMLIVKAVFLRISSKQNPSPKFARAKLATLPGHLRGAIAEELVVRGYPFQILIGVIGIFPAAFATSVFFGLLHYQSQHLIGTIATSLAGLLLATAVLKTNALWLAIGIHFSWNFMEALLSLEEEGSRQRYLVEILVIIIFWILLMMLPIRPHPEMERLWREYILRP